MRAIAILFVVATHAQTLLPVRMRLAPVAVAGGWGVDIFFALSGFLIGSILLSLAPRFKNVSVLPHFWQRRWFRTLPNYYLFLAFSILIAILLSKATTIPNLVPYLIFTQAWLWPHPAFFPIAWSLAIEEWFYLLFPLGIFLIQRLSKSFTVAFLVTVTIFIIVPTLIRIQLALSPESATQDATVYFHKVTLLRLDAIVYGVLAAWIKKQFPVGWVKSRHLLLIVGTILVFASWFFADRQGIRLSFFAKTFLLSFVPLGFACMLPVFDSWNITKENPITRALRLIALWSYSLYLSNFLILQIFVFTAYRLGKHPVLLDIVFFIFFYITCMVVSSIAYTYFEKPMINLREKFSGSPHTPN